jgi:hypothetical protein
MGASWLLLRVILKRTVFSVVSTLRGKATAPFLAGGWGGDWIAVVARTIDLERQGFDRCAACLFACFAGG